MMNKNSCIDQQEDKLHELEQIIENVKKCDRESYSKYMNESGQNPNDKKTNLRLAREQYVN